MKPVPVFDYVPTPEGFVILRDSQPLKTPADMVLALPSERLAQRIVEEWRAQMDKPLPATMPFTQLAMTAIDIVSKKKPEITASISAYAESDLLCHRAAEPPELAARQTMLWQPWLDWAAENYSTPPLRTGQGIMPVLQPQETLIALRKVIDAYSLYHLAGLQQAVGLTGSLILGLALADGKASTAQLFDAAELEAIYQIEKWGEDPVTVERHASLRKDLERCEQWFRLLAQ